MSTGYKISEQDKLYYITLQVVDWIDIFSRQKYRDIIIENLTYCQKNKGLDIFAWVIMSNHIHLIVRSETAELSATLRDFKSYTSKVILEEIKTSSESRKDWMLQLFKDAAFKHVRNSEYQFWTHENHAEILHSNKFIQQKLGYIHNNPVRAGIVFNAEEYKYSSAIDYADGKGLLEVILIERGWKTIS
jgi:REP element-mobilizing transposase RayT